MDALESLLKPLVDALNRNVGEVTRARELCAALDGSVAAVRVKNTGLAMYMTVGDGSLDLKPEWAGDVDVVISGSLLSLARLAGRSGESVIRDGKVELSGDAERAQQFRDLLLSARPDVEEELSRIVGDPVAHGIGEVSRGVRRWFRDARTTMGSNVREYLQEESGELPSRYELERFADGVGRVRDDVERIAARIARLEGRH